MKIGTKSVLYGVHCFFIHPWFVALAWWKLYGFPKDWRMWVAFFVHDLGYIGKPNMDGPEGETHPDFGADFMHIFFDFHGGYVRKRGTDEEKYAYQPPTWDWYEFTRYHSRYLAKKHGKPFSRLCVADKLAIVVTWNWLYMLQVRLSGEIHEYLKNGKKATSANWKPTGNDARAWRNQLCEYMTKWVAEHKDGAEDTWTTVDRHAKDKSGVCQ